ncbi:MaoC/PaaZ C-terminal domain-containing protein [Cytobacillus sp. Hm23]
MKDLQVIEKDNISHTQIVKYAGASGDFNPIHTVVPIAKSVGLPDVIAHGMLVMGMAGDALTQWFPRKDLRKFKVRFSKMTFPGEKLSISGKIVEEKNEDGDTILCGRILVQNENEELKLKGDFEVVKN